MFNLILSTLFGLMIFSGSSSNINSQQQELLNTYEPGSFQIKEMVGTDLPQQAVWLNSDITNQHIKKAAVEFNAQTGNPYIMIEFNDEGTELFADLTKRNIGKPLGIFVNDELISAPIVQEPITEGKVQLAGNFTVEEANDLATIIKIGTANTK